ARKVRRPVHGRPARGGRAACERRPQGARAAASRGLRPPARAPQAGRVTAVHEIVPGIYHWSTFHAPIRSRVSSYFIAPAGIVIDPKIPETGIESLPGRPEQIV